MFSAASEILVRLLDQYEAVQEQPRTFYFLLAADSAVSDNELAMPFYS